MLAGEVANKSPSFGTFCVGQSIIRIELDCLIEVTNSFAIIFEITTLEMEVTLKVSVMCLYTAGSTPLCRPILCSEQGHFERISNRPGYFLLNCKDIFQLAIERSRP